MKRLGKRWGIGLLLGLVFFAAGFCVGPTLRTRELWRLQDQFQEWIDTDALSAYTDGTQYGDEYQLTLVQPFYGKLLVFVKPRATEEILEIIKTHFYDGDLVQYRD